MSNVTTSSTNSTPPPCLASVKVPFYGAVQILNILIICIHYVGIPGNVFMFVYCCLNKKVMTAGSTEGISSIAAMGLLVSDSLFLLVFDIRLYFDDDTTNQEYMEQLLKNTVPWTICFILLGSSNAFSLYLLFIRYLCTNYPSKKKVFDSSIVLFTYLTAVVVVAGLLQPFPLHYMQPVQCVRNSTIIRVFDPNWRKSKTVHFSAGSAYFIVVLLPGVLVLVLLLLLARTWKTYEANPPEAHAEGHKSIVSLLIFAGKYSLLNFVPFTTTLVLQLLDGSKLTFYRRMCYLMINLHLATTWIMVLILFPLYRHLVRQRSAKIGKTGATPKKNSRPSNDSPTSQPRSSTLSPICSSPTLSP